LAQAHEFTDAWVEIILSPDNRTVDLVDKIRALPGVIALRFEESTDAVAAHNSNENRRSHLDRPAGELFREYYKSKRKSDPEPQLVALFERLYQEAAMANETGDPNFSLEVMK